MRAALDAAVKAQVKEPTWWQTANAANYRQGRAEALEEAATWLRQEQASLILRMNRYADRFEKQPGKEAHAETVRNWVRELDDIAAAIRALRSKQT
jgi:head-tail adaptor